jgi:hypothetical protein
MMQRSIQFPDNEAHLDLGCLYAHPSAGPDPRAARRCNLTRGNDRGMPLRIVTLNGSEVKLESNSMVTLPTRDDLHTPEA